MVNNKAGIGIIGAGLIGVLHSSNMRTVIDELLLPVELVHAADLEEGKASRLKELYGFRKTTNDPCEVIKDEHVNAVMVCTWTSEHREWVEAAAREKKHVFCEKPLGFDAGEAMAMARAVEEAGVINQVGLVLRQGPVWNVLRGRVRSGDLGLPLTAVFRDDQCFPIKGAHPSRWRKDREKAGHGTLIEHSIHDLDLLEWIFGPVKSLRARTACRFGHPDIEDLAHVYLEFDSGMSAALVSVWHDVLRRHSNRRVEVFHQHAFHALESEFTGPLQVMQGEGDIECVPEDEVNKEFWEMRGIREPLREISKRFGALQAYIFLNAVLEQRPAEPGFRTAVRAHRLVDACYRSADADVRIEVDREGGLT